MTELKDVLKFYIGCNCEVEINAVLYIEPLIGIKFGRALIGGKQIDVQAYNSERLKPILRKLSDITDAEYSEWAHKNSPLHSSDIAVETGKQAAATAYLLSRGFDLFRLIENGSAIDAASLNQ